MVLALAVGPATPSTAVAAPVSPAPATSAAAASATADASTPSPDGIRVSPAAGSEPTAAPAGLPSPVPSPAFSARPRWERRIDRLTAHRAVSVCVGVAGRMVYRRRATVHRAPASNEKLILSMALLDRLGAAATLPTIAEAPHLDGRTIRGALWIRGSGDPEVGRARMRTLAHRLKAAGIRRIKGRVMGSIPPFAHDWWAPGWRPSFPATEVARPTALTFEGNRAHGRNITDPERRAAASLTSQLRSIGVRVRGRPGAGRPPRGTMRMAVVRSAPLEAILRRQNVKSRNFYAEVLGKLLGERRFEPPGTIRKGARAVERWTRAHGVHVTAHDGSGLSYRNRVTAAGIVRLLWAADQAPWGTDVRGTLARGGRGTLTGRLRTVDVRAKTGTLDNISALSGWVRLQRTGGWADFSILSRGLSKTTAIRVEDRVVHAVAANAG